MPALDLLTVALDYHKRGWNVIPVYDKQAISKWEQWQETRQTESDINRFGETFNESGGIAIICGEVSGNLMVVDLDGQEAIVCFHRHFPKLTNTYTVKTGNGKHLYFQAKYINSDKAVESYKWKDDAGNGYEIAVRMQNCYVVAPPSRHRSGVEYKVVDESKIMTNDLNDVLDWIAERREAKRSTVVSQKVEEVIIISEPVSKPDKPKLTESERHQLWAQTALTEEFAKVAAAGTGERNDRLYHASLKMGSIIAGGYLTQVQVESSLMTGADLCGLVKEDGKAQCEKTIRSGITAGMQSPRHPDDKAQPAKHGYELSQAPGTQTDEHPLSMNPDAEELALYIQGKMEKNYTYFGESWQVYEDGTWNKLKNLNRGITQVVKSVRHRSVKANPSTINNVSFFLQTYMELMDESVVDDYANYINVRNGMFNLDTMTLEPHSPKFYITGKTNWDYDPKATCPVFLRWLSSMLTYPDGTPDIYMLQLVQEAFGYSMTTDTRYRMSFWLKGPKHSGKSTLLEVLSEMLNIYHGVLNLNELEKNRFMLALTYGKRVVTCAETEKGVKIPDGQYKTLVDNASKVVADIKNKEPITFKPTAKIWWAMNNYPRITDNTGAVHSRVSVIPYHRSITIEERDLDLMDKIRLELSGIANWSLEGLQRLNANKRFTIVAQSEALKEELQVKDSVYRQFLDDEQWCKKGTMTLSRHLNDAFIAWCKIQGIRNTGSSDRRRKSEFEDAGLQYDRVANTSKYIGVELTDHAMRQISTFWN